MIETLESSTEVVIPRISGYRYNVDLITQYKSGYTRSDSNRFVCN